MNTGRFLATAAAVALALNVQVSAAPATNAMQNDAIKPAKQGGAPAVPGKPITGFRMADRAGKTHTNKDFKGKTTVLVWSSPNSAASKKAEESGQLADLAKLSPNVKVAKVQVGGVVDPQNGPQKRNPTPDQPTTLLDLNNDLTKKMGISQSQTVVVLDGEGKVVYQGAMDNDPQKKLPASQRKNYAEDAVKAALKGEKPKVTQTAPNGDSIAFKGIDNATPKISGKNPQTRDDEN